MASVTDAMEGVFESPTGILLGVGAVVLAPIALPVVGRIFRPAAKLAYRGYLVAADYLSGVAAEVREGSSDLMAEVEAERKGKRTIRTARG